MKEFSLELYFYSENNEELGLLDIPDFDLFSERTILVRIRSKCISTLKIELISKYKSLAYIHVLDVNNLNYYNLNN